MIDLIVRMDGGGRTCCTRGISVRQDLTDVLRHVGKRLRVNGVDEERIRSSLRVAANEPVRESLEQTGEARQRRAEVVVACPSVIRFIPDLEFHGRGNSGTRR